MCAAASVSCADFSSTGLSRGGTMSNEEMTREPLTSRLLKATALRKLLLAAALALVLVPLGSVAIEASSISCGFVGVYGEGSVGGEGGTSYGGDHQRFHFG